MTEVERLSKLSVNKMMVVEVFNNKIYRTYDDINSNLRFIHRRTNELVVFEHLQRANELPIQPKKQVPIVRLVLFKFNFLERNIKEF